LPSLSTRRAAETVAWGGATARTCRTQHRAVREREGSCAAHCLPTRHACRDRGVLASDRRRRRGGGYRSRQRGMTVPCTVTLSASPLSPLMSPASRALCHRVALDTPDRRRPGGCATRQRPFPTRPGTSSEGAIFGETGPRRGPDLAAFEAKFRASPPASHPSKFRRTSISWREWHPHVAYAPTAPRRGPAVRYASVCQLLTWRDAADSIKRASPL
jgi:hypothetical protein